MNYFRMFNSLCIFAGAALFAYGLWLAWHPLGFITGGLILMLGSIFLERGRAYEKRMRGAQ